jgi:hypothetical protein
MIIPYIVLTSPPFVGGYYEFRIQKGAPRVKPG